MTSNDGYAQRFGSIARLYGQDLLPRLSSAHVAVVGVGGVGSWAVEALARSGIGQLTLIDLDDVCVTNMGRQLPALSSTVGRPKIEVLGERIREINPECALELIPKFFVESTMEEILSRPFDVVLDAIDKAATKTLLIGECHRRGLKIVTCGAAGGRVDPTKIQVNDLGFTSKDQLLQQVRKGLREQYNFPRGPHKKFDVPCVFSLEEPSNCGINETARTEAPTQYQSRKLDCNSGYGAASYITGTFGFFAAAEVVKVLRSLR